MTKQRRTFSAEFKRESAGFVLDQGYSHIEACRSLGVVESVLRRSVNQLDARALASQYLIDMFRVCQILLFAHAVAR